MKFKDKVVLVTGGGTGLGRAMCLQFAGEGAAVIVNYSKSEERAKEVVNRIDAMGGQAADIQADVSYDNQARQLIEKAVARFGRLDILINNDGWTRFIPHNELAELSEEVLKKHLAADAHSKTGQTILVDGGVVALGPNA